MELLIQATLRIASNDSSVRMFVFSALFPLFLSFPLIPLSSHCSLLTVNGSQGGPFSLHAFRHFHHFVTWNVRRCHFHRTCDERWESLQERWAILWKRRAPLLYTILYSELWQFVSKFRLINGTKKRRRKQSGEREKERNEGREKRVATWDVPGEIVLRPEDSVS